MKRLLLLFAFMMACGSVPAVCPIVMDIPSPIVGDKDTISPANTFVYPDAFNLANWVFDAETTDSTKISWYYKIEGNGPHHYSINNCPEVDDADIVNFGGGRSGIASIDEGKIIAGPGNVNRDPLGTQTRGSCKITIRNKYLSPIGGPNQAPANNDAETEIITLYSSDGETVSAARPIFFYTHAAEINHLSGCMCIQRASYTFPTDSDQFVYHAGAGHLGVSVTTQGLCMSVGNPSEDATGYWESPFGAVTLVPNAAYRIRITLNGTQTQANTVPLWTVSIQNFKKEADNSTHGIYAYGADFYMFDNMGGENAAVQLMKGDTTYDFWWTPPAVQTARWNDSSATKPGVYSVAARADDKDSMIWFRILDNKATRNADLHTGQAVGTLCLKSMEFDRFDLDDLKTDPTPVWQTGTAAADWSQATWAAENPPAGGAWHAATNTNGSIVTDTQANGYGFLLSAAAAGSDGSGDCYGKIQPGDYLFNLINPSDGTTLVGDYPCPYEAKALYKVTYMLSAPTMADQNNPLDAFWLSCEMMTDEELFESYDTNMGWGHGMPAYIDGTTVKGPQPFIFLFYTNYGSNCSAGATGTWWRSFAPEFAFTNNHKFSGGDFTNRYGAIKLHSIKVERIVH